MTSAEPIAFLNGELIPFREAKLPVFDLGIVQGATVIERLRTVNRVPYQVDEHLDRLENSLSLAGWKSPHERDELKSAIKNVVEQNVQLINTKHDVSVVIFITAGQLLADANGTSNTSSPTCCIHTGQLPFSSWSIGYKTGRHLMVPEVRQIPRTSLDPQIKMRSRLHWRLADEQVRAREPGAMALLLDEDGFVTETSSGNLFVVKDGILFTPRQEKTLPGIAQRTVQKLATAAGMTIERKDMLPADIANADEVFLTSSTYCLMPVTKFENSTIQDATIGPITKKLAATWSQELHLDFMQQAIDASKS